MTATGRGVPREHPPSALTLDDHERAALLEELERFVPSLPTAEGRARYQALSQAVAEGRVEEPLAGALETLLEIALESGAARKFQGPPAELALRSLFFRTPRGAGIQGAAGQANRALGALAGQRIESLSVEPHLPGVYRLVVATDRCQLTLEIDRDGVRGRDMAVGA